MNDKLREKAKELTLMLLYLNSWEEKIFDEKQNRAWKGYDFDVLNVLSDEGLIHDSKRSKSISFSESGIAKAKELLKGYDIDFE